MSPAPALPIAVRFWRFVRKTDGCWWWTGSANARGYGSIRPATGSSVRGKAKMAHRLAWELANGPIPEGHYICHRCDNPSCVNPAHLFVGTPSDNMRDCVAKGRSSIGRARPLAHAALRERTHCKYGHPYTADNLYAQKNGTRKCRTCARRNYKAFMAKRKQERAA